jgi:hypothetical protein
MVLASTLGYGVQLIAPLILPSQPYVGFSAFWSVLFLCVSAMSGVQNEVARSSSVGAVSRSSHRALARYTWAIGGGAVTLGLVVGLVLTVVLHLGNGIAVTASLILGVGGYAILAVVAGVLYGVRRWGGVALVIVADPAARGVLFAATAALSLGGIVNAGLTWMLFITALPFLFALILTWIIYGRTTVNAVTVDGTVKDLLRNSLHTIMAASALGFMASGMPLVISMIGRGANASLVAGTILIVVLTRAPLVSPLIALQSYLTVGFRDSPARAKRRVAWIMLALALASAVLAGVVLFAGPALTELLPGYTLPSPPAVVFAVLSAGLVGMQCVTGAAVLARNRHRLYAAGCVVTALGVVGLAFVPLGFEARLAVALSLPPLAGMAVHLAVVPRTGSRKYAPL